MSTSLTSGQDPYPNTSGPGLAGTLPSDLLSDPLLKPGSFICNVETPDKVRFADEPSRVLRSSDGSVPLAAENAKDPVPATSVTGRSNAESTAESKLPRSRRKVSQPSERPDWLPPGWVVEDRVRASGATAGSIDKYYVAPGSGRKFRSKKEVLYFLETGSVRKKVKNGESTDSINGTSTEVSRDQRQRNPATKARGAPLNFDFSNVPDKVKWVLNDSSASGSWAPFIDDKRVPDSGKQEWAAAFTALTFGNGGRSVLKSKPL